MTQDYEFTDLKPEVGNFKSDVIQGLSAPEKYLHPKYYYDETGAELFDKICRTDEYYLYRKEMQILPEVAKELNQIVNDDVMLIEYGGGYSKKIQSFLSHFENLTTYIPIDISREFLKDAAQRVSQDYPELEVHAICADFLKLKTLPEDLNASENQKIIFFPGSTIGNFEDHHVYDILTNAKNILGKQGLMLIGLDLIKNKQILDAAYNDEEGVTAAFNLNILERINRELGGNFNVDNFSHISSYNTQTQRMETFLEAKAACVVSLDNREFPFTAGERIHTEFSHKYDLGTFAKAIRPVGFELINSWTDSQGYFAEVLIRCNP